MFLLTNSEVVFSLPTALLVIFFSHQYLAFYSRYGVCIFTGQPVWKGLYGSTTEYFLPSASIKWPLPWFPHLPSWNNVTFFGWMLGANEIAPGTCFFLCNNYYLLILSSSPWPFPIPPCPFSCGDFWEEDIGLRLRRAYCHPSAANHHLGLFSQLWKDWVTTQSDYLSIACGFHVV